MVVVGFGVFWPMLRLSQSHPCSGHTWFALRDAIVLFIPLQAVLWPHISGVLAHWPIPVVACVALLSASWLLVLAGVLALGMRSIAYNNGMLIRLAWMLVILVIVLAAPIAGALGPVSVPIAADQPRVGWLLSPMTGVLEIVRDREALGVSARVYPQQIRMLIAIGCVGLALLLIARAMEVAHARVRA